MKKDYKYLLDTPFLQKIDKMKNKEQHVRIILLDINESPIKEIQGRIISGTVNIDGTSVIRRTCNLTMIADEYINDLTNVNNLISINKKIDLEIGFSNITGEYNEYPIIWFPLGVYVIINPSISNTTSGVSISLQLKDKMCLLNGECGGIIPSSTTLHEYEIVNNDGEYEITQPTIYRIIQELVNHFGGEQLGRIIISDIDTRVKKVMKWIGNSPLYIIEDANGGTVQYTPTTDSNKATSAALYKVYSYGDDIGYIYTDFIYPEELIADAGNSVCDILDRIKSFLGNFEYYYDIDGNFIFQEIKNYLNTSQSTAELNKMKQSDYLIDFTKGKSVYTFEDSILINSFSNTPQYNMIKNDFIVWGVRETTEGQTIPIRYHLSIDSKPKVGNHYNVFFYEDKNDKLVKAKCPIVYPSQNDFPLIGQKELFYMDNKTKKIYEWDSKAKQYNEIDVILKDIETTDWRTELYLSGSIAEPLALDSNYYYVELSNEWTKLYDIENGKFKDEVLKNPSDIDYYLDFIDTQAEISVLSVSNIGRRTQVVNNNKINCIFEPKIPNLILLDNSNDNIEELRNECIIKGEDYIQLDGNHFSMITGGGHFNSAYHVIQELLYQYTSYNENITLNAMPIFYLDSNIRITVRDSISGIYGDYVIKNITLPLDISGTMSVSCVRALERI